MSDNLHIVCPHCHGVNRVPRHKLAAGANCGRCKRPLFTGLPLVLDEASFAPHASRSDIPLLVDFWASWCGPCKMMAPVFERAAGELEPNMRLAKVNTEEQQNLSARYAVRSIPTLILFKHGQELARVAGAMDLPSLLNWARQH
ncbi:MAG: thioredoxin TrxC [Thiohalomonadaceae bacterium]